MALDLSRQMWPTFRGRFRGPGGDFRGPRGDFRGLGQVFVATAEGFRGAEGHFRGPGQFRQAMADPFQLNKNPLPISAQR